MLFHDLRAALGESLLLQRQPAHEVVRLGDVDHVLLNLLQPEAEVRAEQEECTVEVHLVQRDHEVVDAVIREVFECLLEELDLLAGAGDEGGVEAEDLRRGLLVAPGPL